MNIPPVLSYAPVLCCPGGVLQSATGVTQRLAELALKYFGAMRQSGFFMLGTQDLVSGAKVAWRQCALIGRDEKVTRAFWKVMGGCTLLISGVLGLWSSLDYINKEYASGFNEQLFTAANIFFLFSSMVRLKTCLDDYIAAKSDAEKISAMMGVGANLYYIVSASLMLFGPPGTFVIVLCSLGTTTSLLQAVYDFTHPEVEK